MTCEPVHDILKLVIDASSKLSDEPAHMREPVNDGGHFYSHLISSLSNICSYMCNFCVMYMLHLFYLCYATMRAGARLCVFVRACLQQCG